MPSGSFAHQGHRNNPETLTSGPRVLADDMTSEKSRAFLADFAAKQPDDFPLLYPADTASPFAAPSGSP